MNRRPLFDPQSVPIEGMEVHLPPVPDHRLSAAALRERFAARPDFQPEFVGDTARMAGHVPTCASVLVPLVVRPDGLQVLLTRRAQHLRDHPGQISFPGGRAEPADVDAAATALREAHEEVGLSPLLVEVLGVLPTYTTVTSFVVTPVVALVEPGPALVLDTTEVDEAFEVPLRFLMTPAHHRRHRVAAQGQTRQFISMHWRAEGGVDAATDPGYFIWGATAAMLRNLYRYLSL
jgi:8-oxo-dGTP pyrophosphatase MutT (NUDIX family)